MKRKTDLLITILFCAFLGGICIASFLVPDQSFSELENRNLEPVPILTVSRFRSGDYMEDAEEYVSDHIVLREKWVALHALAEWLTGKQQNGGTYFAADGSLINQVPEPDEEDFAAKVSDLNRFAETVEVPLYIGLIPTAASVWNDKLPAGAPTADEQAWIQRLYEQIDMESIDIAAYLQAHADEPIYYRTDHHWTSLGAFYGADAIFEQMDLSALTLSDYSSIEVSDCFCGTTWSSACAWWVEPDNMEIYVPENGIEVISNFTGKEEAGSLYNPEKLQTKNKYAYFLGGNQPLCVLRSENDGPRLLVIRDSYSDCLAPFLSRRFSEVHLFDLRYNRSNVQSYIEDNQIDAVLVLYSFSGFLDANQFFQLTR